MLNHNENNEAQPTFICLPLQLPSSLPGPLSADSLRLESTVTMPSSPRGKPNPESSQIPERLKVLLKTLAPKGIHVPPRTGSGPDLCLSDHGIRKHQHVEVIHLLRENNTECG